MVNPQIILQNFYPSVYKVYIYKGRLLRFSFFTSVSSQCSGESVQMHTLAKVFAIMDIAED